MKIQKTGATIAVLAILLVIAISYIAYSEYSRIQIQNQISIYQQGLQSGYEQAIIQVAQQAVTCQQVPLRIGNQTVNIIAADCLKQAQQGQPQT